MLLRNIDFWEVMGECTEEKVKSFSQVNDMVENRHIAFLHRCFLMSKSNVLRTPPGTHLEEPKKWHSPYGFQVDDGRLDEQTNAYAEIWKPRGDVPQGPLEEDFNDLCVLVNLRWPDGLHCAAQKKEPMSSSRPPG